LFYYLLFLG